MRLSTQGFYSGSLAAMQLQAAELARLQNQVAIGRRVNSPADDPIAAVHILELERVQSESAQFAKNSTLATGRLNLEEQALTDAGTVLHRVRELTVAAANIGTMSDSDRESTALELAGLLSQLQETANRQDSGGEYIFGGFSTLSRPFTGGGDAAVSYAGDQGNRLLQVSATQRIPDSHSGFEVFMKVSEGNGVFATSSAATNTGTGQINVGSVVDRTSWLPDDYTLTFTSATTWQVTDSATPANVVVSGPYTAGAPIEFNGVRVEVSGVPAVGDSFAVTQSRSQDMFATLQGLVTALRQPASTPAAAARLATALGGALQQIDQASDHLLSVRAEVGSRLSTLEAVDAARESLSIDVASSLSELRDLDYAEALTKMNQRLVGLQAAQMSYAQISQLSLFNYLK